MRIILRIIHALFPALHAHKRKCVSYMLDNGRLLRTYQQVCPCGDVRPL